MFSFKLLITSKLGAICFVRRKVKSTENLHRPILMSGFQPSNRVCSESPGLTICSCVEVVVHHERFTWSEKLKWWRAGWELQSAQRLAAAQSAETQLQTMKLLVFCRTCWEAEGSRAPLHPAPPSSDQSCSCGSCWIKPVSSEFYVCSSPAIRPHSLVSLSLLSPDVPPSPHPVIHTIHFTAAPPGFVIVCLIFDLWLLYLTLPLLLVPLFSLLSIYSLRLITSCSQPHVVWTENHHFIVIIVSPVTSPSIHCPDCFPSLLFTPSSQFIQYFADSTRGFKMSLDFSSNPDFLYN